MEIPSVMENKLDDKKKEIFKKINLDKITSPYARLMLRLMSYGVSIKEAVNIKTAEVLAQAYPWCKPLTDDIVAYISNDRGRIGAEYFLGYKQYKKASQQQSVKNCVRSLRIVLTPQGITIPMIRYIGDVTKAQLKEDSNTKKEVDPADQLLKLLKGRVTSQEYSKLMSQVKTIQQEEAKADNAER